MKKTNRLVWTVFLTLGIVCNSCFCADALPQPAPETAEPAGVVMTPEEARLALEAAKDRAAQTETALKRAEAELQRLRKRYADLYLENREQKQELEYVELRVAHLLAERSDIAGGETVPDVLRALEQTREAGSRLEATAKDFGVYLVSVLDVLQPSDALRGEIGEHWKAVEAAVRQSLTPLSTVAGRGSGNAATQGCRVLAANDELDIVVLDRGFSDGVRPGTRWKVFRDAERIAVLRIIETRSRIAAAILEDGKFDDLIPGLTVRPD